MVMNKRAQFFLLAAVIISAIVISFGVTTNEAITTKEPGSFYDFSYEVNREVGEVLNYEIYSDFDSDVDLETFVELFADNIREKDPNSNFIFIYGDNEGLNLRNYGSDAARVGSVVIEGSGEDIISEVCVLSVCRNVSTSASDYDSAVGSGYLSKDDIASAEEISVEIGGYKFSFPISEYKKVIFIRQKEVGDESFISVG